MPWNLPSWNQISTGVDTALALTGAESSKWRALQGHVANTQNKYDTAKNAYFTLASAWNSKNSSPLLASCNELCKEVRNNEPKEAILNTLDQIKTQIESQ